MKVMVIGAGPAGLSAAYILAENGIDVCVLEKEDFVGGISRTVVKGNYRFDLGGHRFFTKNQELNAFLDNLLGNELINVGRQSRIYFNNKYFNYPLEPINSVFGLGLLTAQHILLSYFVQRMKKMFVRKELISLQDWVVDKFGYKMFELYFKSYTEKVWGIPCDQIAAEWVAQRIKGMSMSQAIKSALMPAHKNAPLTLLRQFRYPQLGICRICERMAEKVNHRNRILMNASVIGIKATKNMISSLVYSDPAGKPVMIAVDNIISSMPITELLQIIEPKVPNELVQCAQSLRYRDFIAVTLMLDKDRITNDTWLYIHDSKIGFGRIHEPKNWSPSMSPDRQTSLVMEYFCFENDAIWSKDDKEIVDMTIRDLVDQLGFIQDSDVIDSCVVRVKKAYPMYEIGYKKYLNRILDFLSGYKNLQLIGRNGTFRYNNMDHSIEMGIKAAHNILGGKECVLEVNVSDEYFEEMRS